MRITIDNLDGQGALDYTSSVTSTGPVILQRKLNTPSRCTAELLPMPAGLPAPARRGRVVVTSDDGEVLFTGYLATEPVSVYAGQSSTGPVYRMRVTAVSDEWLLDRQGSGAVAEDRMSLGLDGGSLLSRLAARVQAGQSSGLEVSTGANLRSAGPFQAEPSKQWSTNAAAAAGAAYASYRAMSGQVLVQSAGAVTHSLSDADGTLSIAELQTGAVRELANDVTISGAEEPAAYVSEIFLGDGTTTTFELSEAAFRGTQRTLLRDDFATSALDTTQWTLNDPGGHMTLTTAGLALNGGNGQEGQTTLTALDAIEMGGSLVIEVGAVTFGAGSDGTIGALYNGAIQQSNCFAGFRVRQSTSSTGGETVVIPVWNGTEVGEVFTPAAGHTYILRIRLHSMEMQRVMQTYYCMVDGNVQSFCSSGIMAAPMDVVFEIVDTGVSSNTPATVLYDSIAVNGAVSSTPGTCVFVLANSTQLFGSIGSASITQTGSVWVVSTLPSGMQQTRLIGSAGEGADCRVAYGTETGANGKVTFFAGRVPVANERVTVQYRTQRRSVARLANAPSIAAETIGANAGTSRWLGKVLQPIARSSADCESAAQAMLAFATSRTAAVAGTYTCTNPTADIWPGDVLAITSGGATSSLLVRSVEMANGGSVPETLHYKVSFANDWATEWEDGLGLRVSESIAANSVLPQTASGLPGEVLANLQQLTVTSLSDSVVGVDTGLAPPVGGGFEVRRRDYAFGAEVDGADLVLRSPVRSFSIPRAAQVESFYIRMYDSSTPPVYSRFSSAVFVNAPVA